MAVTRRGGVMNRTPACRKDPRVRTRMRPEGMSVEGEELSLLCAQ